MTVKEMVAESNLIEGITRDPTYSEEIAFEKFMLLEEITLNQVYDFVDIYQPDTKIRDQAGMDVRVGNYIPPKGGPGIREELEKFINKVNRSLKTPVYHLSKAAFECYIEYEKLHPFMDCNGRSGRMIWYWMMKDVPLAQEIGFLRIFHKQTLENN